MPRKLEDIEISEISLVDKTANRKKFAIIKRRQEAMDELIKLLKSICGDSEITEEVIALAKALTPEAAKAIKEALSTLNSYSEAFDDAAKAALKTLARYSSYGYPAKKADDSDELPIEKVGARLSKATMEELKKLKEILVKVAGEAKGLAKAKDIIEALLGDAIVTEKYADMPEPVRNRLRKLDALEAKEKDDIQKSDLADKVKGLVGEVTKPLQDRIDTLEKTKGISKAVKGQGTDDDKDDKDVEDHWGSFHIGNEVA